MPQSAERNREWITYIMNILLESGMMMTLTRLGGSRRKCRWSSWRPRMVVVWTWETTGGGPNGWEQEAHLRKRRTPSPTTMRRVIAAGHRLPGEEGVPQQQGVPV